MRLRQQRPPAGGRTLCPPACQRAKVGGGPAPLSPRSDFTRWFLAMNKSLPCAPHVAACHPDPLGGCGSPAEQGAGVPSQLSAADGPTHRQGSGARLGRGGVQHKGRGFQAQPRSSEVLPQRENRGLWAQATWGFLQLSILPGLHIGWETV